jgi:transposase
MALTAPQFPSLVNGLHLFQTYFNNWRKDGTWATINERLRMQVRVLENRHPSPSAAICDAQSVKVGNPRCFSVGFDGGKLIKGWKRHILVDTMGLLLMVIVTAANVSDQRGAKATPPQQLNLTTADQSHTT